MGEHKLFCEYKGGLMILNILLPIRGAEITEKAIRYAIPQYKRAKKVRTIIITVQWRIRPKSLYHTQVIT